MSRSTRRSFLARMAGVALAAPVVAIAATQTVEAAPQAPVIVPEAYRPILPYDQAKALYEHERVMNAQLMALFEQGYVSRSELMESMGCSDPESEMGELSNSGNFTISGDSVIPPMLYGDAIHDDTAAIQWRLDRLGEYETLDLPNLGYRVKGKLKFTGDGQRIGDITIVSDTPVKIDWNGHSNCSVSSIRVVSTSRLVSGVANPSEHPESWRAISGLWPGEIVSWPQSGEIVPIYGQIYWRDGLDGRGIIGA